MNKTISRLVAATAATTALVLIPLAAIASPAASAATTAPPDPHAVPMVLDGNDSSGAPQVFYWASSSAPAVQLTTHGEQYGSGSSHAVLMPDGHAAVLITGGGNGQATGLEIVNVTTGAATVVAQSGPVVNADKAELAVAPDGSAVAFLACVPGDCAIYVQKFDGSPAYQVSPADNSVNGVPTGEVAWSHDGKSIAYSVTSFAPGEPEGTVYAPAGGGGKQVMITSQTFYGTAWTPDDRGLLGLAQESPDYLSHHLMYADLGGTVTPVASWPGRTLNSVSVDQHWDVFMSTHKVDPSGSGNDVTEAAWLGDPGTITTLINNGYLGNPQVATGGVADPRPATLPSVTPPPPPTPQKQVILFELRGSRANAADKSPTDGVINTFTQAIKDQAPGLVIPVPVDYRAIPLPAITSARAYASHAYVDSEQDGIRNLKAAIRKYPKTARIAFVGYSSGAQVVRTVVSDMSTAEQNRVAFVVTYGNPLFLDRQSFNRGTPEWTLNGIYWAATALARWLPVPLGFTDWSIRQGHAGLTKALAYRTEDWCQAGDPVANFSTSNLGSFKMHFAYAPDNKPGPYIIQGAAFAAGMVR